MLKATILSAIALTLTAGCATYSENGAFGGFREIPLARDTYRIQTSASIFQDQSTTSAMALVRAADLASQNGYDRFIVVDYDEWSTVSSYTTPTTIGTTSTFSGNAYTNAYGYGYGNYATVRANTSVYGQGYTTTTINPGQTYNFERPHTDIVVRFISRGARDAGNALLVNEIVMRYGQAAGISPEQSAALIARNPSAAGAQADTAFRESTETEPLPPEPFGPPQLTRYRSN